MKLKSIFLSFTLLMLSSASLWADKASNSQPYSVINGVNAIELSDHELKQVHGKGAENSAQRYVYLVTQLKDAARANGGSIAGGNQYASELLVDFVLGL